MDEDLLREISKDYLVPFFSGASLDRHSQTSGADDPLVALLDENRIAFKVSNNDSYRLVLKRRQQFSKEIDVIPETSVVRAFIDGLSDMGDAINGPLQLDLLSTFQRRIVARSVAAVRGDETILLTAIDQLASWSNRLYEGMPISAALGFRN